MIFDAEAKSKLNREIRRMNFHENQGEMKVGKKCFNDAPNIVYLLLCGVRHGKDHSNSKK